MIRLIALACLMFATPALAQEITDGSGKAWPPEDIAKIMAIMGDRNDLTAGAQFTHIRRAAGADNDRIYCGVVVDMHSGVFMADIYAGVAHIAWADAANDDYSLAAVGAYECDKITN